MVSLRSGGLGPGAGGGFALRCGVFPPGGAGGVAGVEGRGKAGGLLGHDLVGSHPCFEPFPSGVVRRHRVEAGTAEDGVVAGVVGEGLAELGTNLRWGPLLLALPALDRVP